MTFCQKLRRNIFKRGWKLSRMSEGCAMHSLSWGKVGEVINRVTKEKEKPGKIRGLTGHCAAGAESGL